MYASYVLTDKWLLVQKLRISMVQFTDHKKLNKIEAQSVNASIQLRMGNKIITGGRGREGPGWERGGREEKGNRIRYGLGEGTGEKPRGPREGMEINSLREWEWGNPLESARDQRSEMLLGLIGGDLSQRFYICKT